MKLFDRINNDIKKAMLAKEKEKLEALRAVKAAFLLAKTAEAGNADLTDEQEMKIIQKLVKQRQDSAEIFKQQNRMDLYEPEQFQAGIIAAYLPKQLSVEEVKLAVTAIVKELNASSIKDMGAVMAESNKRLAGQTDSKTLSGIVRSLLS